MLSLGLIFFRTLNEGCHIHRRKNIIDRVFLHLQELLDNLFWSISVSWKMNDTILQMDIALFYVYIIYNFYISILYLNSNWMYRLWWRFETPALPCETVYSKINILENITQMTKCVLNELQKNRKEIFQWIFSSRKICFVGINRLALLQLIGL